MAEEPPQTRIPAGLWAKKERIAVVALAVFFIVIVWAFSGTSSGPSTPVRKPLPPASRQLPTPGEIEDLKKRQEEEIRKAAEEMKRLHDLQNQLPGLDLPDPHASQAAKLNAQTAARGQAYPGAAASMARAQQTIWKSHIVPGVKLESPARTSPPATTATQTQQQPRPAETIAQADKKHLLPEPPTDVEQYILPEGQVLEAVLLTKLNGSFSGPLKCQISVPSYAPGTRVLVLPQGSIFLGRAETASTFGQNRMAVTFHRLLVGIGPKMYAKDIDKMPGLDVGGATALRDRSSQHLLSSLAVAGAVGGLSGLSSIGINTGSYGDFSSQFRMGLTSSTSMYAMQILSRLLNRPPEVEIRPGTRVKIMLTNDLLLPAYELPTTN